MNEFLLIYEGGDPDWAENSTDEEVRAIMAEWAAWFERLEASGHLRNPGNPLARGGAVLTANGERISIDRTLPEVKELVGGFSVIAAESLDEAIELAKGVPMLARTPGTCVVVRPIQRVET